MTSWVCVATHHNNPYVVLKTSEMGAHAEFTNEKSLASLTAAQRIVVRCRGANVIIGSARS